MNSNRMDFLDDVIEVKDLHLELHQRKTPAPYMPTILREVRSKVLWLVMGVERGIKYGVHYLEVQDE